MKRIIIALIVTVMASSGVFAQKKTLRNAEKALRKEEIAEAKQLISEAEQHEETSNMTQTYFVKGQIYAAEAKADPSNVDAETTAIEAFMKVKEMAGVDDKYSGLADLQLSQIYTSHRNNGATAYEGGDLQSAYDEFVIASMADPKDTTVVLFAGYAAQQMENFDDALLQYTKLINMDGYTTVETFSRVAAFEMEFNEDYDAALDILRRAQEIAPENQDLKTQEINILIKTKKADEARAKLQEAIKGDPENSTLYYNLGFLNDELGNGEESLAAYKKAIEINPDYYQANFNVAVVYYNKAAEITTEANALTLKEYQKQGPAMEKEAKSYMEKSLPYWEKAYEIRPEEEVTITTLMAIYTRLGMNDKAMEMKEKADEMGIE